MAADGAWPKGSGLEPDEPDDARTRRAVEQLRAILTDLESRMAEPRPAPMAPEAAALTEALAALARRMAAHEGAAAGRYQALGAALRALAVRLDRQGADQAALEARLAEGEARIAARLDQVLDEFAAVRAVRAATLEPEPGLIKLILGAASAAAALSVMGAGAMILAHPEALPKALSAPLARLGDVKLRPSLRLEPGPPRPALDAAPPPVVPIGPAFGPARETYDTVAAALDGGEASALPRLTGLAQAGDSRAQLALASLYEAGGAGVSRDLVAARLWTRRAAEGGDRVAMHNLALFLSVGQGGGRDDAEAASWFQRAADRGVVDSQYNLGLLYEAGRGVEKNLREAYRWFAVAANAGDASAREKQVEIEGRLTAAERGGLDRDVSGYRPGLAQPRELAVVIIPPAATLSETQALLARKGYYVGPVDGVATPAFRSAAAAYLRDHPIAPAL